ncbi:MAG: endonuclease/exonuclease/phosphatase family protein [Chloroflexota bacterium]
MGVCLLAALLYVRLAPVPNWWPLLVLDTFALYVFGAFVGVAALALVLWSRALSLLFLAAALFFVQQFSGPLLSLAGLSGAPVATADESRPRLRLLTLNLHSPNNDPTPFMPLIRRADPDVIVLQEVTTEFAQRFDALVQDEYLYSATTGTYSDHEGTGTWSRLPLVEPELLRPSRFGNSMHRVRISTGHGDVWLYNVHLPNPTGDNREDGRLAMLRRFNTAHRDFELRWLIEQTEQLDIPFILAGDFNTEAGSYQYRSFPEIWQDAFAAAGRGFGNTYPAPAHEGADTSRWVIPFALLRIDYILTSPEVRAVRVWTDEVKDSDHFSLAADLELTVR